MGNSQQQKLSPDQLRLILGDDTSEARQSLTEVERSTVESMSPLFDTFYKDPTVNNYQLIRNSDDTYQKYLGDKYTLYIWAIREKYKHLNDPLSTEELAQFIKTRTYLATITNRLSARDLDKLWTLYYATGDPQFPHRISLVSNDANQFPFIRQAATWSYQSHLTAGKISQQQTRSKPQPIPYPPRT